MKMPSHRAWVRVVLYGILVFPTKLIAGDVYDLAGAGKLEEIKRIVEQDPTIVNKMNSDGYTPLHCAAKANCTGIIRYLVNKGANLEAHDKPVDHGVSGHRPLHVAALNGSYEAAMLLIQLGADPKSRTVTGIKGHIGISALDFAAWVGDARIVALLLKKGVSPFRGPKSYGMYRSTALHWACRADLARQFQGKPESRGNRKVIWLLVPAVKDVNMKILGARTPLHVAAGTANSDVVDFLLQTYPKIAINATDGEGNTALHLAVSKPGSVAPTKARVATIKALLKHKPDLTIKNGKGQTPRARARATGNTAIIALFP